MQVAYLVSQLIGAVLAGQHPISDERLLSAVGDTAPTIVILSSDIRATERAGGRLACGIARVGDDIEPFAVVAMQRTSRVPVVTADGHQDPGSADTDPDPWRIHAMIPYRAAEADAGGRASRGDLDWDALTRRLVLAACPHLVAPDGVIWSTQIPASD